MKSRFLSLLPLISVALIIIYGFGGQSKWPGGSPGGYSGSPGDGKDCTQCHGGNASLVLGWISSDIPDDGYIPGETYTINITVTGSGDKGFEVSPQDEDGNAMGTVHAGTGVHLVNGNKAVTHNNGTSANPAQWQFEWTAPTEGTGAVTFYGAFTVNKPVTKLCTYVVQENTGVSVAEYNPLEAKVYPNPAQDKINVTIKSKKMVEIKVRLLSTNAKSVYLLHEGLIEEGKSTFTMETPGSISPGTYILQIQGDGFLSNNRILIIP